MLFVEQGLGSQASIESEMIEGYCFSNLVEASSIVFGRFVQKSKVFVGSCGS